MKHLKHLLFLLLLTASAAHAQIPDSLTRQLDAAQTDAEKIRALTKISEESIYKQPDQTIAYAERLLALAQKNGDEKAMAASYLILAKQYSRSQDFEKSLLYLEKAEKQYTTLNMPLELIRIRRIRAENEMRKGNFEVSMKILQANIDESKKLGNLTEEAINMAVIGNIFSFNLQYGEAEKQILEALAIINKTDSKREKSLILLNLAACYMNSGKFEEGKKNLDEFFVVQQELNDPVLKASAEVSMANYHVYKEQFGQAIRAYDEALRYFEKINETPKIAFTVKRRADLYLTMGEYKKAIADANRCIDLLKKKTEMDMLVADYYYIIYQANKALGNYKEGMEAFETAYEYKSKSLSAETANTILELKEKYKAEKKEEEIKLLEEQNKTKDALLQARTYSVIALSLLVVFGIVGIVLFRRQQRFNMQKKASELEHRVLRAQMNPHFIFNALNSIQRVYVEGNTDRANDFMADFAQLMRKVLEHSGSAKISVQEEVDTLRLYMDLEKLRSKNRFAYTITVDENISAIDTQIPPLIIQPFVENAIWHGVLPLADRKGEITISLKGDDEGRTVTVSVTDNGVGFHESEKSRKHISKGIEITEQRIGSKVAVQTVKGAGTTITFTIKTT